jgi:hypothetical protein
MPGKGTRFTVSLPATVPEPVPLETVPTGAAMGRIGMNEL